MRRGTASCSRGPRGTSGARSRRRSSRPPGQTESSRAASPGLRTRPAVRTHARRDSWEAPVLAPGCRPCYHCAAKVSNSVLILSSAERVDSEQLSITNRSPSFIMYQDEYLRCVDCGRDFAFTAGEQEFSHPKASKTSRTAARIAGPPVRPPARAVAAAAAADAVTQASAKCSPQLAANAEAWPKCRSSRVATSRCTAAIASQPAPAEAVIAK